VYIDPPDRDHPDADAVVSWWVVNEHAGGRLEQALDAAIPGWLREKWGLENFVVDPPAPGCG